MQHRHLAARLCLLSVALAGCAGGQSAASAGAGPSQSAHPGLPLAAGSSGPADGSLTGVHACELIPAAARNRVLGRLNQPPFESSDGLVCFYYPAVQGGIGPDVILTVTKRSGFEAAMQFVEGAAQAGVIRFARLPGIGDDGYSVTHSQGSPQFLLGAAKAGRGVTISVASTNPVQEQRVRELMNPALARL
jgi:hypothetical protein